MFRKLSSFMVAALLTVAASIAINCVHVTPVKAQAFSGSCASIRGSFTATLTGYAAPPTGTVQFRVTTSCTVVLWTTAAITGTSNAATMTMTGVPYNIQTNVGSVQLTNNIVQDNGALATGCISVANASGTLTFSNSGICTGVMTSSAAKGLPAGWTVTYSLY